ncbi:hypothetical protein U9M48_027331 [Paspalum notatum var. saurae]|uniref:Oxidative stress 3 n=1 Tax=Paspalum notatum var. saurae TaxID=547442 RepID=A0AAQ3X017_PASNO
MMGEAAASCDGCEAAAAIRMRAQGAGGGWTAARGTAMAPPSIESSSSSSSIFSSTSSLTTDKEEDGEDGATSSSRPSDRRASSMSSSSLASSESMETFQVDAAGAGGPLYELSAMMDHLPPARTGLSKHYQGRSQSFTSLADVSCVEDLAKKTTPYIRRPKASRRYAAPLGVKNHRFSKTAVKKAPAVDAAKVNSSNGDLAKKI